MGRRVLVAWELGGNLGHIAALRALGRGLRERGHEVLYALQDLTNAGMLAREGFSFLPAPARLHQRIAGIYPSYAAMLAGEVFQSAEASFVGALAWRAILRAAAADLLVADHAPLALLAARGQNVKTLAFSAPFAIPVAGRPLPIFTKKGSSEDEVKLLRRLNKVLDTLRAPRLEQASDLYRCDATIVRMLPEIDCFGPRPADDYVVEPPLDAGDAWPAASAAKALVYLKAGPYVKPVLAGLSAAGMSVIAYIGGLPRRGAPLERPGLFVSHVPFKASALIRQTDVVICNGNAGTVTQALLAGKPVLMLPTHVEQALNAASVLRAGAGLVPKGKAGSAAIAKCCEALRPGTPARASAASFAKRYAGRRDETMQKLETVLHA
jgi:UDP:flavonoid glycosyltransferase YjiC (YdhE family)